MDAQATGPERGMLNKLRGGARFFDRKIGLSRIGFALSLTIIVVAVVVLYHILRGIDPRELVEDLKKTDLQTLVIAGLFTIVPGRIMHQVLFGS